jgi:hypothetical protein
MTQENKNAFDIATLQISVEKLIAKLDGVITRVDNFIKFAEEALSWNRQIIKWLLAVVCIIALGKSALEMGKQTVKDMIVSTPMHTEVIK